MVSHYKAIIVLALADAMITNMLSNIWNLFMLIARLLFILEAKFGFTLQGNNHTWLIASWQEAHNENKSEKQQVEYDSLKPCHYKIFGEKK